MFVFTLYADFRFPAHKLHVVKHQKLVSEITVFRNGFPFESIVLSQKSIKHKLKFNDCEYCAQKSYFKPTFITKQKSLGQQCTPRLSNVKVGRKRYVREFSYRLEPVRHFSFAMQSVFLKILKENM